MQALAGVVIGGLIGGIFALAGVFLGPLIKGRQDEVQWRREKRLDAYAEHHRAVIELLLAVEEYEKRSWKADPPTLAMDDFTRAESRVRLLAPKGVREASHKFGEKLFSVLSCLADGEGLNDTDGDEVRALHEAFAEAARRDLGVQD